MRSISIETQCYNTTHLFDYNPLDKAGSYIIRAITHERRLVSKINQKFDAEEETAKHPPILRKETYQDSKLAFES